jgi:putative nucleotidyltransferase with HDIG domain
MLGRYEAVTKLVGAMSAMHEEHNHHGALVAELVRKLSVALGMPPADVDQIEVGAHLHDIGKLQIDKRLLNARRQLLPDEHEQVQKHATIGWAMVDQAGFEPAICEIVRHHHERYDGNGYPDRLSGPQLPIGAQIVGLCDVYSALVNPRPYRPAYTASFAQAYLQHSRGQAFDAHLVDRFFEKVIPDVSHG